MERKLAAIIEKELLRLREEGYTSSYISDCDRISKSIAKVIVADRENFRSGRRLYDRLRDKLIDIFSWKKV